MGRTIVKMTMEDFKQKIKDILYSVEDPDDYEEKPSFDPYGFPKAIDDDLNKIQFSFENYEEKPSFDPYGFPKAIDDDLNKIQFSFENFEYENGQGFGTGDSEYPCGYHEIRPGYPVLFVNAGGDWEIPIVFIIYYSGKGLRAYIPKEGNPYNKEKKAAYGNNDDEPDDDDPKGNCDAKLIIEDIIKRLDFK